MKTWMQRLCQPIDLNKEFVVSTYTYQDIYRLAAGICEQFSSENHDTAVCLMAKDKGVMAASVLASLVCPMTLILPYSYSKNVLTELHTEIGFTHAISEDAPDFLSGVEMITPKPLSDSTAFIESLPSASDADREFLKLFTGGSTGKSKLWSKTYRNLLGEALYLSETFNISENDILMATVPSYHIYGLLFSVLLPMISSASVLPDSYRFPQEILSAIRKYSATVLVSVPLHYRALNQSSMNGSLSIKTAFSSAAPLAASDSIEFYRKTGIGITEVFGSTETGGIATRCQAFGENAFKPFDPIDWKIEDERLCIRSDFVSPTLPKDADGFFMTGDRVSRDGDRFILLGRSDDIVKIAGKRVDLKEVQLKLMQIKGVRNAVVYVIPENTGRENEIVALIEGDISESDIRVAASRTLESYAAPRRIRIVENIPVSSTGKYAAELIKG